MRRSVVLIVLDGWGIGPQNESNPIHVVRPETFRLLEEHFPVTSLQASGISVGLPWGEVGNSEVGHLTIGAGKVIYQYYPRITLAIRDGSFFRNEVLIGAVAHAKRYGSAVNLVGLLSKGNVHASLEHINALVKLAAEHGVDRVNLHLFADGKDSPPKTLERFLAEVPRERIATLTGRYYAMDRNKNWNLTEAAYACLVGIAGERVSDPASAIAATYAKGHTEEFLPPLILKEDGVIQENDAVIFLNYRKDSIRQIAEAFILDGFDAFPVKKFERLSIVTMTRYEERFKVPVAFPPENVERPLGKLLEDLGKTQLRIAETYKYAHVTYFFNGYREEPYKNEYRVLIPSLTTPHPDDHPELQAAAITDRVLQAIEGQAFDFILVNYANPDTIAHTGNYQAALETVRVLDREIGRVIAAAKGTPTILLITSDHGNIEQMISPVTGYFETQHDPSPVPFYLVAEEFKGCKFINWRALAGETAGILADIAPTILELMKIPQPKEMTGRSLLRSLTLPK